MISVSLLDLDHGRDTFEVSLVDVDVGKVAFSHRLSDLDLGPVDLSLGPASGRGTTARPATLVTEAERKVTDISNYVTGVEVHRTEVDMCRSEGQINQPEPEHKPSDHQVLPTKPDFNVEIPRPRLWIPSGRVPVRRVGAGAPPPTAPGPLRPGSGPVGGRGWSPVHRFQSPPAGLGPGGWATGRHLGRIRAQFGWVRTLRMNAGNTRLRIRGDAGGGRTVGSTPVLPRRRTRVDAAVRQAIRRTPVIPHRRTRTTLTGAGPLCDHR